jgi:hypothetical protein
MRKNNFLDIVVNFDDFLFSIHMAGYLDTILPSITLDSLRGCYPCKHSCEAFCAATI